MSRFTSQLLLRSWSPEEVYAKGGSVAIYTLLEDLVYDSDEYGQIVAPKGLTTDFASIPRPVWSIISPDDPRIEWPSVIHDALYLTRGKLGGLTLTRQQCDDILREAMQVCGAGIFIRNAVYRAVRFGGYFHWKD